MQNEDPAPGRRDDTERKRDNRTETERQQAKDK